MQIRDLSKPVTSVALNESLAKKFGYTINLEQFTDVQLEDARNKLRTKLSQYEVNESYDTMVENPQYQKTRMFLDCVNQAILEREATNEGAKPDFLDMDKDGNKKETMKKAIKDKKMKKESAENIYFATIRSKAREHSVPESWIDNALSRMELGESDQEELSAELTLRYDLSESQAERILYLSEGEEQKAEVIMSTKDMVDQITGWLEDVAALKAEHLLELLDSIRETQGNEIAQRYSDAVKPALEAVYTALETSRQGLSTGLSIVSGGEAPTMGAAPSIGGAMPASEPGMAPEGELGGAPEGELGGEELPPVPGGEASREKRESIDYSRKLGMMLSASKKK
jgi:predicted RNA-binding protein with PIN domain